ncbi:DUF2849 domain-containing protein [Amaricoccus solimangrovi]|uniref:DUF2849 domain-containing protein n=1 Tax=Amaricoccus solimangrovi TaxID=2589815 RepID=A0A501WSS9_9RHOB|nr:DUF2849 domain-containing protein [Amaricoccus solimangrovi]TPE51415.1 DUF2849 domain-containing protein [Amaricoccus solimangrovi]
MAPRAFKPQMATGNDLLEGDVVYFTAEGGWSRHIAEAAIARDKEAAEALLARAEAFPNQIVGVYLTDVTIDPNGHAAPAHFREDFRTRGPSNYPEHQRQA